MNLCKTCGTICPFDDERTECDAYAPMTNENWFISLPTEEKAKWLDGLIAYCFAVGHITETEQKKYQHIVADIEVWLKQPHTSKE